MKSFPTCLPPLALTRRTGSRAHAILAAAKGLDWVAPHRALVRGAGGGIELTVVDEQSAYVDASVATSLSPRAQLERSHALPGNLRFTRDASGSSLRAELSILSSEQLDRALSQFRGGLVRAMATSVRRAQRSGPAACVDSSRLASALRATCWQSEGVVELDGAWEIRPRVHGFAVPVRVSLALDGVRFRREVTPEVPRDAAGDALVDAALRMQATLRFARLALEGDALCAEACVGALEIEPRALEIAAVAVATASRAAHAQVSLLLESACVAAGYAATLLPSTQNPC